MLGRLYLQPVTLPTIVEVQMQHRDSCQSNRSHLAWGVILVAIGSFWLASALGLSVMGPLIRNWYYVLIAIGIVLIAIPGRAHERWGGYWMMVVGIWGYVVNSDIPGLDWGNAWAIFIIAAGFRLLIGSLLGAHSGQQTGDANSHKDSIR
jgi:hypothetical protein